METEKIKTENRLTTMEQKIDNLIEDVKEIGKDIKELDSKYSGKWVEKAIVSIGTALIISAAGGIITYIINC